MTTDLRKIAADTLGRAALEERFSPVRLSALDIVLLHKQACADQDLLRVAASFETSNAMRVYEELGGRYKEAVSLKWVADKARDALPKAGTERVAKFTKNMVDSERRHVRALGEKFVPDAEGDRLYKGITKRHEAISQAGRKT